VQKYTGTLTANVTIILPPTVQVYYIINDTDGTASNFTLTFTTNSGGGVATVTAGNQIILLCDSVNLLNANTIVAGASTLSLVDGNAGTPSLNFSSELTTGIYRPATGQFGISILGTQLFGLAASGLTIYGTGTFINGIYGGSF